MCALAIVRLRLLGLFDEVFIKEFLPVMNVQFRV